ncbi:hypothetical protein MHU86_15140 [Fragilaria crotonensis]|nr:hypothetical protein MHU86_15140 [Fragilaria crotonensis]
MSIPNRPGRKPRTHPLDPALSKSYGDAILQKSEKTVRLFFQNVHGLTVSKGSDDYRYFLNSLQSLHVDVAGLAETNTCWQHSHLRDDFTNVVRRFHRQSKTVFGSPTTETDPIPLSETFQAGGTVTMVMGSLVSRVNGGNILDSTGLGRWSGVTFSGTESQKLTVITAYRVCSGSIRSAPLGSSFAREYNHFHSTMKCTVNPRRLFLRDLQQQIAHCQEQGHAIVVMMDANATIHSDTHFADFLDHCALFDLHANDPADSTYIGAESRRIDFIFGCHQARLLLERSGTLAYNEGPQSDHRGLYVDLKLEFFSRSQAIPPSQSRTVHTGNPELVQRYNRKVMEYYTAHNMVERINKLANNYKSMSRAEIRSQLIAWDNDKGRAMKAAENVLSKPPKKCRWSQPLETKHSLASTGSFGYANSKRENYSATFRRWQAQIRVYDKKFCFPFLNQELSETEVRAQFNKASSDFHKCQSAATPMRFKCYEDLISTYENDTNPITMTDSRRKASIVRRTIDCETIRNKFRDIRRTVKPAEVSSLSKIQIPVGSSTCLNHDEVETNAYHILQHRDPLDIMWETVIDRKQMEAHLISYNRDSFRAASESPLGNGVLYDAITFSGLSLTSDHILAGMPPHEWINDDQALREFLASFTIPESVHKHGNITTEISKDDVLRGFQSWRESTSTSPSGRHLGLYKSEIQHPTLLDCFVKFMNISVSSGISIPRWSQAVSVLIEKDAGQPRINRLRIIHLFEADFNFFLKLQWGHRLVQRALSLGLLHNGQHGSIPGRMALDPVMLTQLSSDLCRVLKHDYARFDNDASSCYDRIIVGLGMLAARKCGMPQHAIRTHADSLKFMQYTVKTVHGISEENYHGTVFSPLFGTGQGAERPQQSGFH